MRSLALTLLSTLLLPSLNAQTGRVSGTILDSLTGQTLSNVQVKSRAQNLLSISDSAGHFELLDLNPGDYVLQFSTVGYRVVATEFHLADNETKTLEVSLQPDTGRHVETISVRSGALFESAAEDVPGEFSLSGNDIMNLSGVLADDPLRSVQALPGVSSNDDFEARFSLHGADFSRIGVYLDGVQLHSPIHTLKGSTFPAPPVFSTPTLSSSLICMRVPTQSVLATAPPERSIYICVTATLTPIHSA